MQRLGRHTSCIQKGGEVVQEGSTEMELEKRLSVLIADKKAEMVKELIEHLQNWGYATRSVYTREDLVKEIESNPISLAIIDTDIDEQLGAETLKEIKRIDPDLPVIMTSSDDSLETEVAIRKLGVFYYCLKPYDPEEVHLAIDRAGDLIRAQEASLNVH